MIFTNLFVLLFWRKVAWALEGLSGAPCLLRYLPASVLLLLLLPDPPIAPVSHCSLSITVPRAGWTYHLLVNTITVLPFNCLALLRASPPNPTVGAAELRPRSCTALSPDKPQWLLPPSAHKPVVFYTYTLKITSRFVFPLLYLPLTSSYYCCCCWYCTYYCSSPLPFSFHFSLFQVFFLSNEN